MTKVFLISAIIGDSEASSEQVNIISRHLACRGNDVTLFDISHIDYETLKEQIELYNVAEIVESADAIVVCTNDNSTQLLQSIYLSFHKKLSSNKLKRSSNVWNVRNGVCCTILGGTPKKSKVARELWEVFQEPELDLSDIFPHGSPRLYNLDYTKETAQPMVV